MSLQKTLLAAALGFALAGPAAAATTTFTNGTFDTGLNNLTGWTAFGDVKVLGARKAAALTTASLDFQDDDPLDAGYNNHSGIAAVDFAYASNLAGIPLAKLDTAGGGTTYEGSAIRQEFTALAGDTLTIKFDWTFLSADTTFNDFAFIAINDTVVKFVDASMAPRVSKFNNTFGDFSDVTWGWTTADYTYTAAADGTVSMVIGVVDLGDYNGTSELRVDNITVNAIAAVPEPSNAAMLFAGLGLFGLVALRRRQS